MAKLTIQKLGQINTNLHEEIKSLKRELKAAKDALKPFANWADRMEEDYNEHELVVSWYDVDENGMDITVGVANKDLVRAREVFENKGKD